jgi:ATPase involved in DNA replication initiation
MQRHVSGFAGCGVTPLAQSVPQERIEDATLREVCEYHRVSEDAVRSQSRLPEHVEARHDWWATLWASGWSYSRIARTVGRDHSTIMEAARTKGWGK